MKKKKSKQKRKLTEREVKFIEEFGEDEYQEILELIPELKISPALFESVVELAHALDLPSTPQLEQAFDEFRDSHPVDDEEG